MLTYGDCLGLRARRGGRWVRGMTETTVAPRQRSRSSESPQGPAGRVGDHRSGRRRRLVDVELGRQRPGGAQLGVDQKVGLAAPLGWAVPEGTQFQAIDGVDQEGEDRVGVAVEVSDGEVEIEGEPPLASRVQLAQGCAAFEGELVEEPDLVQMKRRLRRMAPIVLAPNRTTFSTCPLSLGYPANPGLAAAVGSLLAVRGVVGCGGVCGVLLRGGGRWWRWRPVRCAGGRSRWRGR